MQLSILTAFLVSALAATPLNKVIQKVQASWDNTRAFQADFKQTVYSKTLKINTEESAGKIYVLRPNHLRWVADEGKTVQLLTGNEFKVIQTNERRKVTTVEVYRNIQKHLGSQSLQFLAGKVKLTDSYHVEIIDEKSNSIQLKLTPKQENNSYIAEVNKKDYFLSALTTDSSDTKVEMKFSNVQRNRPMDNSLFVYEPKPDDLVHVNP